MLYYLPRPGEQSAETEAIAPVLDQLVLLEGNPTEGRNVEHLTFRGLAFFHCGWWLPADGTADRYQTQASAAVPGAVQLYGAQHCRFEQCAIGHVSSYAIHFSRGCAQDQLVGSELFDLGAGGVKIGEPDRLGNLPPGRRSPFPNDPRLETHDIEIADNDMRAGGRIFHQGQGVWVGQSYNNLVAHNEIHDFYQIGIAVGWTWGYGTSLARNNIIESNHVHHIGQRFSSDLDEGSADIVVEKNIVYHTTTGGFGMNYGRRNTIRNNIFAFGEVAQWEPLGNMPKAPSNSSYVLERNLFYWQAGQNLLRGPWQPKPGNDLILRNNLYWQEGGGKIRFGTRTWSQWQARGWDSGSVVADPLFQDPAHHDFRLKPNSPASQIRFEPFDLSEAGPRAALLKRFGS